MRLDPIGLPQIYLSAFGSGDDVQVTAGLTTASIILQPGTFSFNNPAVVPSHRRIVLQPGATITQPAGTYLGNVNGSDQAKGFFVNSDTINGNTDIEICGGLFQATQPNAANTSYTNATYMQGVSRLVIHDTIIDGCGFRVQPLTAEIGSTQPLAGHATNISFKRITIQNSAPYGISVNTVGRLKVSEVLCRAGGAIDDILAIQRSCQTALLENCDLDKNLTDGVHTMVGNPVRLQANSGDYGYENLEIRNNRLVNSNATPPSSQAGINYSGYGTQRNLNIVGNQVEGNYRGLLLLTNGNTTENWKLTRNLIRNNTAEAVQIQAVATLRNLKIRDNSIYNNNTSATGNPFAIRLTSGGTYDKVLITGNDLYDDSPGTQTIQLRFEGAAGNYTGYLAVVNNYMTGTAFAGTNPTITVLSAKNNYGFNPQGFATTTPAVPATTVDQQNTNPYPVRIYFLTSGTVTAIKITDPSGGSQTITTALGALDTELTLDPLAKIALTYTGAPTWKWYGI